MISTIHISFRLLVWSSFMLSVLVVTLPCVAAMAPNSTSCQESDPTDASEEIELDEATFSDWVGRRRLGRAPGGHRRTLLVLSNLSSFPMSLYSRRLSAGQVSRWGRCGPLRC